MPGGLSEFIKMLKQIVWIFPNFLFSSLQLFYVFDQVNPTGDKLQLLSTDQQTVNVVLRDKVSVLYRVVTNKNPSRFSSVKCPNCFPDVLSNCFDMCLFVQCLCLVFKNCRNHSPFCKASLTCETKSENTIIKSNVLCVTTLNCYHKATQRDNI